MRGARGGPLARTWWPGYYRRVSDIDDQNDAHRRFGPVYFTELRVAGVRCFGPEQLLSLAHGDRAAKWAVILGENGVGKTTLLQCLWAMAPHVAEARPGALAGSFPRAVSASPRSAALRRAMTASLDVRAELELGADLKSVTPGTRERSYLSATAHTQSSGRYPEATNVLCCGYGALRRSSELSVEAGDSVDSAASLFSDDASLVSGSAWFLRADYAAKNATTDARAAARRDKVRTALIALLPDVSDIQAAGLDEENPRPRVDVKTPYGWVPMRALSLGYRSMIAWVVDLASRLFEAYPDSPDPLAEPAIALVDEIDLHLHPRWQRDITAHLDRLFPNVQFIVTAHSPLVVQGAGITNVAVLRRVGDHVEILNDPEQVRGWRVDQILTSDLFGLSSARPVEVERLLERQQALVLLDAPTDAQRASLAEVDAKLADLTPGETAQDRETWATVRRLAQRLAAEHGP
jgi:hypothetical protein